MKSQAFRLLFVLLVFQTVLNAQSEGMTYIQGSRYIPLYGRDSTVVEVKDFEIIETKKETKDASKALSTTDPVAQYMSEVSKYKLLTREEEKALAVKYYETGDPKAAEQLVTANLRFVVKIALEYSKFGAKLIDLIQEGNVGLMQAVKEFNPEKEVKLITYAVWWIRQCMLQAINEKSRKIRSQRNLLPRQSENLPK